jgi:hypothetical protein
MDLFSRSIAISKRYPGTGDGVQVLFDGRDDLIMEAQSWPVDTQELRYLLEKFLIGEKSWLTCGQNSGGRLNCQVMPKGYEYLDELQRSRTDSNSGFCAMWFAESFIDVWNKAIGPAIEAAGYEPIRVDKVEHANRIDDEIISQIRRSKFLVCDFTEQRAGVYFEAGFGLGLGKQVIWTVHKDHLNKVHFDNRQ